MKEMKTILIATDFSAAARNASLYGVQLAKAVGANVILLNAFEVPKPASALGVSISRYSVMMITDRRLLEEADILDPKGSMIEIVCDEGDAADVIINIAKEKKADLVVTGMKGTGRMVKKLFGSTATILAKNTSIPLIIVPEGAKFTNPGVIVFASDALALSNIVPEELILFARDFNSKLYVVKVLNNNQQEWLEVVHTNFQPNKIGQLSDTSFQFPADTDIRNGLDEFIQKHNADLLVMTPHKHEWIERLYSKSQTTDMIFHTKIPLLVLPERKKDLQKTNKSLAPGSKY